MWRLPPLISALNQRTHVSGVFSSCRYTAWVACRLWCVHRPERGETLFAFVDVACGGDTFGWPFAQRVTWRGRHRQRMSFLIECVWTNTGWGRWWIRVTMYAYVNSRYTLSMHTFLSRLSSACSYKYPCSNYCADIFIIIMSKTHTYTLLSILHKVTQRFVYIKPQLCASFEAKKSERERARDRDSLLVCVMICSKRDCFWAVCMFTQPPHPHQPPSPIPQNRRQPT